MARHGLVIVGAGAMGAATAWKATQAGARDVLVLERGQPCSGTSPLGAGLVNRLLHDPLDIGLVDQSMDSLRELEASAGGSFTYHDPGGLLFVDEAHGDQVDRLLRVWKAQALEVMELHRDGLAEVPGGDELELAHGERVFLVEGDGWCVTTDAVQAMLQAAEQAGAQVRPGSPVARVEQGAVVLQDGQRVQADQVVVAAGVWTPPLLEHVWDVPVRAYRPQAAAVALDHPPGLPTVHDVTHHTYWRPEGPGKLVVGDGTVLEPQDPAGTPPVEPGFGEQVLAKLAARWPGAAQGGLVRAWAGFEAGTPDRRPLVGPVPGLEGVHVCTGGNGFGFMRSPALGEIAACLALGRAPPVGARPLAPERFGQDPPQGFEIAEGFAWEAG